MSERNVCPNCREMGPHFIPPSMGEGGFFSCKKKADIPPMPESKRDVVEGLLEEWDRASMNAVFDASMMRVRCDIRDRILSIVEELERENGELKATNEILISDGGEHEYIGKLLAEIAALKGKP